MDTAIGEVALQQRAVREGAGASLLPCFLGDADPALMRLLDPPPELVEDVHLLLHERGRRMRPVRAVADALGRMFQDGASVLCGNGPVFTSGTEISQAAVWQPAEANFGK